MEGAAEEAYLLLWDYQCYFDVQRWRLTVGYQNIRPDDNTKCECGCGVRPKVPARPTGDRTVAVTEVGAVEDLCS